jgi:hypothetical protein
LLAKTLDFVAADARGLANRRPISGLQILDVGVSSVLGGVIIIVG